MDFIQNLIVIIAISFALIAIWKPRLLTSILDFVKKFINNFKT